MSEKEVLTNGKWIAREPVDGEFYRETIETSEGLMYIEQQYTTVAIDINVLKSERIKQIKQEAEERINRLNWRLQRAQERESLNVTDVETVEDVMKLREAIRAASNDAELAVNQLETVEAIESFSW